MIQLSHCLPVGLKLNLGCGPVQPKGWINIDGSNRAWLTSKLSFVDYVLVTLKIIPPTESNKSLKYHNLLKGLPYPTDSVSCIYTGELWEHFLYNDALMLTKECYRVLAPNGVLRVCVPDGPTFWKKYLNLYQEALTRPSHLRKAEALRKHIQMYFNDIYTRRKRLLGSMGHFHKWQYDEVQLVEMFEISGFSQVLRMQFHQSKIPAINIIERSEFLIVEGIKEV